MIKGDHFSPPVDAKNPSNLTLVPNEYLKFTLETIQPSEQISEMAKSKASLARIGSREGPQ